MIPITLVRPGVKKSGIWRIVMILAYLALNVLLVWRRAKVAFLHSSTR